MVKRLRVDVKSLLKDLEIIIKMFVNTKITSRYRSVYRGKGLEFEDYRVYTPEDDASRIDWKASARSNDTLIKIFKEERNLNVYVLVDTSSSMVFGSTQKLKMEYAAEIAAAFSYFVLDANDKVSLLMFNERKSRMVPLGAGRKHFYIILKSLVDAESYGGGFDIVKAINFVMKTSKERGLMVIISDFLNVKGDMEKMLKTASIKFDIICVRVRDPRDEAMPDADVGQFVLRSPFSGDSVLIDPKKIAVEYAKRAQSENRRLEGMFASNNVDLVKLSTAEPFIKPLMELFLMRRKHVWR